MFKSLSRNINFEDKWASTNIVIKSEKFKRIRVTVCILRLQAEEKKTHRLHHQGLRIFHKRAHDVISSEKPKILTRVLSTTNFHIFARFTKFSETFADERIANILTHTLFEKVTQKGSSFSANVLTHEK